MRYWGQNIRIDGQWIMNSADEKDDSTVRNPNAEKFESDVQDLFRVLSYNSIAKVLLDGFAKGSSSATVRPLSQAARGKARSASVNDADAAETDTGSPSTAGRGSSANVWINPDSMLIGNYQYRSKDTLLHECFHALRQTRGRWRPIAMQGWGNREELYATMFTNIYQSNDGRDKDMRSDHSKKFTNLTQTDQKFRQTYNLEILDFKYTMSDIYDGVSSNKKGWNPLRVFESTFWLR